jgi:hypothetical protein
MMDWLADGPKLGAYEKHCVVRDCILNIFIYLKMFLLQFLIIVKRFRNDLIRESCVCYYQVFLFIQLIHN